MNQQEVGFFEAMYQYRFGHLPNQDDLTRELIITPFDGNYGQAGLAISINGSPPKGILICVNTFADYWTIDAWTLNQRWQRIYESSSYSNPRTGKKAELGQAAIALLESKGFTVQK